MIQFHTNAQMDSVLKIYLCVTQQTQVVPSTFLIVVKTEHVSLLILNVSQLFVQTIPPFFVRMAPALILLAD